MFKTSNRESNQCITYLGLFWIDRHMPGEVSWWQHPPLKIKSWFDRLTSILHLSAPQFFSSQNKRKNCSGTVQNYNSIILWDLLELIHFQDFLHWKSSSNLRFWNEHKWRQFAFLQCFSGHNFLHDAMNKEVWFW